jgi:uncharacterized protein
MVRLPAMSRSRLAAPTLVALALVGACQGDAARDRSSTRAARTAASATGSSTGSAGSRAVVAGSNAAAPATDPWNIGTAPDPDAAPTLGERVALANQLCPKVTGPYFFEVKKQGKTSHLLGTRHVGVPLAKFPEIVRDDIKAAKLAVFEVAPDDKSGTRSADEPLRDELGQADWVHFRDLVGRAKAAELEHASAATAAISMLVMYEDITNMLDKQIEDVVANAKIPARGLETAAFQDRVLDKLLDLRMLKATIEQTKDRAEMKKESGDDLHDYCTGTDDSPGMDEDARSKLRRAGYTDAELDAIDDKLVFARNRDWIPKLEQLFEQDGVFVAVGADHLIGKRGVVSLLRARGFEVTRITH